jgi:hypothetical protein
VYSYGVVVLESFSGLLAYSEEREDGKLVDHCEERLADVDLFRGLADEAAGTVNMELLQTFYTIIRGCTIMQAPQTKANYDSDP